MTHHNTGKRHAAKPATERATAQLQVRVRAEDLARWKAEAEAQGKRLAELVRERMG